MPLTRKQIYRRRRITVAVVAALMLGAGVYVPAALLTPVAAATAQLQPYEVTPAPVAAVELPEFGASAVGAAAYGGVLTSAGSDAPVPIASIAKVITALVVLDRHPLAVGEAGPVITTTEHDVELYRAQLAQNGSVRSVRAGLSFTQHELLQLTLIVSANNYTETMAIWAFGSLDAYVAAAHEWLAANGLSGITVVDATGIDPANAATAADLVPLAELAMAHPVIAEIVGTASGSMHDVGPMKNTNPVLGEPGVTGLKTGTLLDFGHSLLFSARLTVAPAGEQRDGAEPPTVEVVGVVLGAPNETRLAAAVRSALATTQAGFIELPLTTVGAVFGSVQTPWGESASLVASDDARAVVWSNQPVSTLVSTSPVSEAMAGDVAGAVTFAVGGTSIEVPLVLDADISAPDPWWRLTNPAEVF